MEPYNLDKQSKRIHKRRSKQKTQMRNPKSVMTKINIKPSYSKVIRMAFRSEATGCLPELWFKWGSWGPVKRVCRTNDLHKKVTLVISVVFRAEN